MKKIHLLSLLLLGFVFCQCTETRPRVIDRPDHGLQSSKTLEINKVELTDSATILYVDAYFRPKNWIQIAAETYIRANGEKYIITGSEGIEINEKHWMPDSGEDHFTLFFPPLPKGTKSFDFFESDCETCFKIWDIDLTGKSKPYKPELPAEILNFKADKNASLELPSFKIGKTKLTVHLSGMREGYDVNNLRLLINNIFTIEQEEVEKKKIDDNTYIFEFDQYSTNNAYLLVNNDFKSILLEPGEEADFYYDITAASRMASRYHPQPELIHSGFTGKYAQINNQSLQNKIETQDYSINLYEDSTILDKSKEQYVDYIFDQYKEMKGRLNGADLSEGMRQLIEANIKSNMVGYIISMERIYNQLYRRKHSLNYDKPVDIELPKATKEDFLRLKELNLNDPMWMYSSSYPFTAHSLVRSTSGISDSLLNEITGSETGLLQDMQKSFPVLSQASGAEELAPELKAKLDATSTPHYKEVYNFIVEKSKRQYEEAMKQGGFTIIQTPDVDPEKILDAIVAQHKGKAIFVDFWATWCGPCLNAMKTIKPIKPEMAEKGVVSIYISNASSPKTKWTAMLPDIGGIHYYLDETQWQKLSSKYEIRGIPTYMIFDKSGKKTFETAGYPGNNKIKEELSKVW